MKQNKHTFTVQKHCGKSMIGIEYGGGSPYRYDGISEWMCKKCKVRIGRWTGKVLKSEELEPPYGDMENVTAEERHYNL